MVRIICGTCGTSQGYKTLADGALTLPAAEERRLVARGVAEYVTKPIIGTSTGVAAPEARMDSGSEGDTPPKNDPASTGQESGESGGTAEDTGELQKGEAEAPDTLDIVDGHFTTESLMELSRAGMEKLAADMGVDVKKCRNKSEIAALLSAVEVQADGDGEAPPELGAEAPVDNRGFKGMLADDIHNVFLNPEEYGEIRTVEYDGERYEDIPIVLSGLKEKDRRQLVSDHVQGLYLVSSVLHCALKDLGGNQPEKGARIKINDEEGGGGFFREFYVASSVCELGMLRVELEAIDE